MVDINNIKSRLLAEEERLSRQIGSLDNPEYGLSASLQDSIGELSSYDNHSSDNASETFERAKDVSLRDIAQLQLEQVRDALASIDEGSYGTCRTCGQSIGEGRLEAFPSALLCSDCKTLEEEAKKDRFTRPIEELVLRHPFGRSFKDNSSYVGFDGEDAWQQVAQYGTANSPQDEPGSVRYPDIFTDSDEPHGLVESTDAIIDDSTGKTIPLETYLGTKNEWEDA